jgi:hypothetical protein
LTAKSFHDTQKAIQYKGIETNLIEQYIMDMMLFGFLLIAKAVLSPVMSRRTISGLSQRSSKRLNSSQWVRSCLPRWLLSRFPVMEYFVTSITCLTDFVIPYLCASHSDEPKAALQESPMYQAEAVGWNGCKL